METVSCAGAEHEEACFAADLADVLDFLADGLVNVRNVAIRAVTEQSMAARAHSVVLSEQVLAP